MRVLWSDTVGVMLRSDSEGAFSEMIDLIGNAPFITPGTHHVTSLIDDWTVLEDDNPDALLKRALDKYWLARARSLCLCILDGLSQGLEAEVLDEVESALQLHTKPQLLLNQLLIRPLKEPQRALNIAKSALSQGYGAVSYVFQAVHNAQPLLRRLLEAWDRLPGAAFSETWRTPEILWQDLIDSGLLHDLLQTGSAEQFARRWNELVFDEPTGAGRMALGVLRGVLTEHVFGGGGRASRHVVPRQENDNDLKRDRRWPTARREPAEVKRDRALKQVADIAALFAQGKDTKARRFLRQLCRDQSETPEYLLMTLCNIAKKCADMFREECERECLALALAVDDSDPWVLVQWGDHLKRSGDYKGALEALEKAASVGERVAIMALADVWVQMGEYRRAVDIYEQIPGWDGDPRVINAIADIRRREARYEEAQSLYQRILRESPEDPRALAGMAEVMRRLGHLDESRRIYELVISLVPRHASRDSAINRLAYGSILKMMGRYSEAFNAFDQILQDVPFFGAARVQKSAVLGILGQMEEALRGIPRMELGPQLREWQNVYMRGLLLLKLERFVEAREELIERTALLGEKETPTVLRLASAYALIGEANLDAAESALSGSNPSEDAFVTYVRWVLQLHIATVRSDKDNIDAITEMLRPVIAKDAAFKEIVGALDRRDVKRALRLEVDLLLRAA